ncbi:MAG: trypsin-like serine protease [Pseudomonadota bacterium]
MKKILLGLSAATVALAGAAQAMPVISYSTQERIVTVDNNNGVVPGTPNVFGNPIDNQTGVVYGPGPNYVPEQFTGVASLFLTNNGQSGGLCTGSRIGPNQILTAAHCLTDGAGNVDFAGGEARFINGDGQVETYTLETITQANVHPLYNGDLGDGFDFAVVTLTETPGDNIDTYELYTDQDELFQEYTRVGFGRIGNGNDGADTPLGFKLFGTNVYDMTEAFVVDVLGIGASAFGESILLSDFDNGLQDQNLSQLLYDFFDIDLVSDLGVDLESNSAPGDSGGPGFIDGKIAGVTSFGRRYSLGGNPFGDIDGIINSSFGEFMGDARVSSGVDFIESFLPTQEVPLPAGVWLFGTALGAGFLRKRAKKA